MSKHPAKATAARGGARADELYIVNVDGSNLRQVTNLGGFTSFPEFSPDGKTLVFVTDWKGTSPYEFNVFTGDWK